MHARTHACVWSGCVQCVRIFILTFVTAVAPVLVRAIALSGPRGATIVAEPVARLGLAGGAVTTRAAAIGMPRYSPTPTLAASVATPVIAGTPSRPAAPCTVDGRAA